MRSKVEGRHVTFCVGIDHEHTYKIFHELGIPNMRKENFDVISRKFNVMDICTSGNYVQ